MASALWHRREAGAVCSWAPLLTAAAAAGEAVAAGAAGLVYMRVGEGGAIDAAKPVKEGLSEGQVGALLAATGAQPVRPRSPPRSTCPLPPQGALALRTAGSCTTIVYVSQ